MKTVREEFEKTKVFRCHAHCVKWRTDKYVSIFLHPNAQTDMRVDAANEAYALFKAGYTTAQAKHEAEIGELGNILKSDRDMFIQIKQLFFKIQRHHDLKEVGYQIDKIDSFLSTYKKTSVPCEECEATGEIDWTVVASPNIIPPSAKETCTSCQGKGTVERWEKK